MLSTTQSCQITLGLDGDTLVHMAIGTLSPHPVKMSDSIAVVPRHGGHIVAAAQIGFEVLRNARRCGGEVIFFNFNPEQRSCSSFSLFLIISYISERVYACVSPLPYEPHLFWRSLLHSESCCTFVPQPRWAGCTFLHTANRWCHSPCPMWCNRRCLHLSAPAWPYT